MLHPVVCSAAATAVSVPALVSLLCIFRFFRCECSGSGVSALSLQLSQASVARACLRDMTQSQIIYLKSPGRHTCSCVFLLIKLAPFVAVALVFYSLASPYRRV